MSRYYQLNDRNWLFDKYNGCKLTTQEIVDEVGCTNTTVANSLRKHNISLRVAGKPSGIKLGIIYGRLTALKDCGAQSGHKMFLFRCECGVEKILKGSEVKRGNIQSCGCLLSERMRNQKYSFKHGFSSREGNTPTYKTWEMMIQRCTNSNYTSWRDYGGRGIKVCDRWLESFNNFLADMGERPQNLTLDRINNNGNYELSNCRWATKSEQRINRRTPEEIFIDRYEKAIK